MPECKPFTIVVILDADTQCLLDNRAALLGALEGASEEIRCAVLEELKHCLASHFSTDRVTTVKTHEKCDRLEYVGGLAGVAHFMAFASRALDFDFCGCAPGGEVTG